MHVQLQNIHKHFGTVRANRGITMDIVPGEIHGLLGENGAGKSTLMKTLAGFFRPTRGRILIDGHTAGFDTPLDAAARGIGMLYQEPLDFTAMTVLENFVLGRHGTRRARKADADHLLDISRRIGFELDPGAAVATLTVGERQQLEIVRLLAMGIRLLILDEPTTGISTSQKKRLFNALRQLVGEGNSVILVSHKLEDVESLCDAVTVLRRGEVSGRMTGPFDTDVLLARMFGSPPEAPAAYRNPPGPVVLELEGVSARGGRCGLADCRADIHGGEIVGLAGLEGSGQGVFLRAIAGLQPLKSGRITFAGKTMRAHDYHRFYHDGGVFVPSDRLAEGLMPSLSMTAHFALLQSSRLLVNWKRAAEAARHAIDRFRIRGVPEQRVDALSGGNQQRLMMGLLPDRPQLMLLENPTRGLDVESANWMWGYLQHYCEQGAAVIFSSSELDEILMVSSRVLVFFNGAITMDAPTDTIGMDKLGSAIAGKA